MEAGRRRRARRPATDPRRAGGCRRDRRGRRATTMCAPAAMPRPGLDHAAEHDAEPERARCVRHAHRLADAARLRELDVDPVRALGARRDVLERVAVLVDVDRHRRACASARARPRIAGGQRLLAVLEPSVASAAAYSSASSSVQYSLTSTCSGRSVTPCTARTRSTSRPSRPPSFSFRRRKRPSPRFSARRAMSSGSPSQIVHEVGGPVAAQAEQPVARAGRAASPAGRAARRRSRRARRTARAAAGRRSRRARTDRRRARRRSPRAYASADSADSS